MELPTFGVGTAHIKHSNMQDMLEAALLSGNVRHVDCAKVYGNEESVGQALQSIFATGRLKREECFITSKLWNDDHRRVEEACRLSLSRLQLDRLDLYLIHWPMAWRKGTVFCPDDEASLEDTWSAMEGLVDKGLTRYIGLSNFDETNSKRILQICRIKPYANQLEIHPKLAQFDLVEFNLKNEIKIIAWSPLGKYTYLKDNPVLQSLAKSKSKTIAQLVLRWLFQRGIASIPRSSKTSRIVENASIFDFELTEQEMDAINGLNENKRLTRDWIGVFDTTPRFPYKYPIGWIVSCLFRFIFLLVPNKIDLRGNPLVRD